MKAFRSTEDGRVSAWENMKAMLKEVPTLSDDELRQRITGLLFFSYIGKDKTREQMVCDYAECLAQRIIRA